MTLIDLTQLHEEVYHSSETGQGDLERENQRLQTLLFATARKYNRTYKELEKLKEFHGFYQNPLPFLHFPREVRDQIYFYCLRAPLKIDTRNRNPLFIAEDIEPFPFKPPTPGLLSANKQVHKEATEVLYSRNNFYFKLPLDLFDFEKRIGPVNCDHIRRIQIWTMVLDYGVPVPSPEELTPSDYQEFQSHWAKALRHSRLRNVNELTIETERLGSDPLRFCDMEGSLLQATQEFLGRNLDSLHRRRVTLCGFGCNEWEKFPNDLKVITRQWPHVEAEIKALEEEMAETLAESLAPWATDGEDDAEEDLEG